MNERFRIGRLDGRSNAQVIIDCVKNVQPGTVVPYEDLCSALGAGARRSYTQQDVCQIVRRANIRLLKEHKRELYNVTGVGFGVAHANQHNQLALVRRSKADRQLERGLLTLKQARFDEMDENSRKVAEGTLMVLSHIHNQMQITQDTVAKHDAAIADLYRRIGGTPP